MSDSGHRQLRGLSSVCRQHLTTAVSEPVPHPLSEDLLCAGLPPRSGCERYGRALAECHLKCFRSAGYLPSKSKASNPPLSLSSSSVLQDTREEWGRTRVCQRQSWEVRFQSGQDRRERMVSRWSEAYAPRESWMRLDAPLGSCVSQGVAGHEEQVGRVPISPTSSFPLIYLL